MTVIFGCLAVAFVSLVGMLAYAAGYVAGQREGERQGRRAAIWEFTAK